MCNTSLQKGVFPEGMKLARVIPLFKNGDMNDFTNYRPISLLSVFKNSTKDLSQQDDVIYR